MPAKKTDDVRSIMCDKETRGFLTNILSQLQVNPAEPDSEKVCRIVKNLRKQLVDEAPATESETT